MTQGRKIFPGIALLMALITLLTVASGALAAGGKDPAVIASSSRGYITMNDGMKVSASAAEESVLLQVFVNLINESAEEHTPKDGEEWESPELARYPLDPHELEEYGDSPRVRLLTEDPEAENPDYLVYRESILLIPQEAHAGVRSEYSKDRRTAVLTGVSGVLTAKDLENKTGLVLLEENAFLDRIFILDGKPEGDGDTLTLPLADVTSLRLNHLFSDGRFDMSGKTAGDEGSAVLKDPSGAEIPLAMNRQDTADSGRTAPKLASSAGLPLPRGPRLKAEGDSTYSIVDDLITKHVSGTNWNGTIKYNPDDFSIKLSFDASVWKLKFEVDFDITGGAKFDITSSGSSNGKETVDIADIDIKLEYGFKIILKYKFVAQFDEHPVHVAGDMKTRIKPYWSIFKGAGVDSFTSDVTYETVEILRAEDRNKDVKFYIGNFFSYGLGWLEVKINLFFFTIHLGPIFEVDVQFSAGSQATARLNKDQYSRDLPDRKTRDSVHSCVFDGDAGCVTLQTKDIASHRLRLKIDLYFKSWDITISGGDEHETGGHEYYNSLTYHSGFQPGVCPHVYYRIPVIVLNNEEEKKPVENATVYPDRQDLIDADVRTLLGQDVTGTDGMAHIFMPYQPGVRHEIMAHITEGAVTFSGYGRQRSDMKPGLNDTVEIILESDKKKRISVVVNWDIDLGEKDRPEEVQVALLEWEPAENEWHVHEYEGTKEDPVHAMTVGTLNEENLWQFILDVPLYEIENDKAQVCQYKVVQLDTVLSYTVDTDLTEKTDQQREAIRHEIESHIIEGNKGIFQVPGYVTMTGEAVQVHRTEYQIAAKVETFTDDMVLEYTEFTNTAIYDVDLHKRWVNFPENKRPDHVYLLLQTIPADGWLDILTPAQAEGLHPWATPVLNPISENTLTLEELQNSRDLAVQLPRVMNQRMALVKVTADGNWGTSLTVKKYNHGVPQRFTVEEVSADLIRRMIQTDFGIDLPVEMKPYTDLEYVSIPGAVQPVFHDWELTGNVINLVTDKDNQNHTIGGVKYWVLPDDDWVEMPDEITIRVEEKNSQAGSAPRVWNINVRGPKNIDIRNMSYEDRAWVWTLTDERIDAENGVYEVMEGTGFVDPHAQHYDRQVRGMDLINTWVSYGTVNIRVQMLWDDEYHLPDAVKDRWPTYHMRLVHEPGGNVWDNCVLSHANGYQMMQMVAGLNPQWIRDMKLEKVSVSGDFFPVVTTYLDPVLSYEDGLPVYTFTVVNRFQSDVQIAYDKAFLIGGWTREDGWPRIVDIHLKRDHAQYRTFRLEYPNPPGPSRGDIITVPRLSPEGRKYLYTIEEETPGYRMLPDDSGVIDKGFVSIILEDKGTHRVEFSYPRSSDDHTAYSIKEVRLIDVTNLWVDNSIDGYVSVEANIHWEGDQEKTGVRPDHVKIALVRTKPDSNSYEKVTTVEVKPDAAGNWSWKMAGLPDGYDYFVLEEHVNGYTTTYSTRKEGHTWTCDVTNTLTGYFTFPIRKVLAAPEGSVPESVKDIDFVFSIQSVPQEDISDVDWDFPEPLQKTLTIRGAGEANAEFLIDEDGLYLYTIQEKDGSGEDKAKLYYDEKTRYLIIAVSTKEDGTKEYKTYVGTEDGAEAIAATEAVFTNTVRQTVTVTKNWVVDGEERDRPVSIKAELQWVNQASGSWEKVRDITLDAENNWIAALAVSDQYDYRVRELNADDHVVEDGGYVIYPVPDDPANPQGPVHYNEYRVTYQKQDLSSNKTDLVISNEPVETIRVSKDWIGFDESEKQPVYLALLGRPEEAEEVAGTAGAGRLVLDPYEGGMPQPHLAAMIDALGIGVDTSLLPEAAMQTIAIGRVDANSDWAVDFTVPKYAEDGRRMQYRGVEVDEALLRQLFRQVYQVDLDVVYDPGVPSVSIPGLTYDSLTDWTLESMEVQELLKAGKTLTQDNLTALKTGKTLPGAVSLAPVINVKTDPQDPNRISGTIRWIGDTAENRPEYVSVHIYADRNEIEGSPIQVFPGPSSEFLPGIPVYENAQDPNRPDLWVWHFDLYDDVSPRADFTVSEEFPVEYDDAEAYFKLYNSTDIVNIRHANDELVSTSFRIRKEWENTGDSVRQPVRVALYENATDRQMGVYTLSEENDWTVTLQNQTGGNILNGLEPGDYYIAELDTPENMRATYLPPVVTEHVTAETGNPAAGMTDSITLYDRTITYTVSNWVEDLSRSNVTGDKIWVDGENQDNTRPESVLVQLYHGTEPYLYNNQPQVVTVSARSGWKFHFPNLPRMEATGEIPWSVREVVQNGEGYKPAETIPAAGSATKFYAVAYSTPAYDTATGRRICDITNTLKDNDPEHPENQKKQITISKEWDIDLEGKDHPDSIDVVIQKLNGSAWETVRTVTLSGNNEWTAEVTLQEKDKSGEDIQYRVRELKDENGILKRLKRLVRDYFDGTTEKLTEWIDDLKTKAEAYYNKLPPAVQTALDHALESGSLAELKEALEVTESDAKAVLNKLSEKLDEVTLGDRIVYGPDDDDRPGGSDVQPSVEYLVKGYQSLLTGEYVPEHKTKYYVSYSDDSVLGGLDDLFGGDESDGSYTITNQAILEIDVVKRWINLGDDSEQPDSAWLVLEFKPAEGALEKAGDLAKKSGFDLSGLEDIELPCFSLLDNEVLKCGLISGGINPVSLVSELLIGVDIDIFGIFDHLLKVAVQKVDDSSNWTAHFVHTKYMLGVPVEFKGAELASEILRQIVKYFLKISLPVSYNPFGNYVSIPGKAYGNLLNMFDIGSMFDLNDSIIGELTAAALQTVKDKLNEVIREIAPEGTPLGIEDWQLVANVINIEFGDDPGPWKDPHKIKGTKVWLNDKEAERPDEITIELLEDGEVIGSVTLHKAFFPGEDLWDWEIDLPEDRIPHLFYTVREIWPEGYDHSKYNTTVSGYDIFNNQGEVTVAGRKTWIDGNNGERKRPNKLRIYLMQDGERYKEGGKEVYVETTAAAGWQWIFRDMPKDDGHGHEYTYSVEEEAESWEYASEYAASVAGYSITNTLMRTDVRGKKIWEDQHNQDGKRPASIRISLQADGKTVKTITVTPPEDNPEADEWPYTFGELPKYDRDGHEIRYTVSEDFSSKDYITTRDGYNFINYHAPEKVRVIADKTWQDRDDQDGIRPDTVHIRLYAREGKDGPETLVTAATLEAPEWTHDFGELDVYRGGVRLDYRVEEKPAAEGYTASYTTSLVQETNEWHLGIINTHEPEKIDITGRKIWDDNGNLYRTRPSTVVVRLLRAGSEIARTSVSAAQDWQFAFRDLDRYEDQGREVVYTVDEVPVNHYTTRIIQQGRDFTITNLLDRVVLTGVKTWADNDNQDGIRPGSVTIRLNAKVNGQILAMLDGQQKTITAEDQWRYAFRDLPRWYGTEEISYTVTEASVPEGYSESCDPAGGEPSWNAEHTAGTVHFTNTHTPAVTEVSGEKIWDDGNNQDRKRPNAITVYLMNGSKKVDEKTVTAAENWHYSFTGLPKYENGKEIVYTISEVPVSGYVHFNPEATPTDLLNYRVVDRVSVKVTKEWDDADNQDGIRPVSVTVNLLKDGVPEGEPCELNEANGWQHMWPDLPMNEEGEPISYSVVEENVDGYQAEYRVAGYDATTETWTWTVINHHQPATRDISGRKHWWDEEDKDGTRPGTIRVNLYSQYGWVGSRITSAEHNWEYKFENLPKYKAGVELAYSVIEEEVPGYASSAWETNAGADIINNKLIQIQVSLEWDDRNNQDGYRPDSVTAELRKNGEIIETRVVTEADGWLAKFDTQPLGAEDGASGYTVIQYTVTEDAPEHYTPETLSPSYDPDNATWTWTIINHHAPEQITLSGEKDWVDGENRFGLRPKAIHVTLLADGTAEEQTTTTGEQGWRWHFGLVPKYREGREIAYTIEETAVPWYTAETNGMNLTNTLTGAPYTVEFYYQKDGAYPEKPDSEEQRIGSIGARVSVTDEDRKQTFGRYEPDATAPNVYEGTVQADGTLRLKLYFRPYYIITYDPNGGFVDGSRDPISFRHFYGEEISIHAAAVREGYLFVSWRGSDYQPGDPYTVTEDHTFTAQWRYDSPLSYRFTFTKKWSGKAGDSISWTLHNPDGSLKNKKFNKHVISDKEWRYETWFNDDLDYYLVEQVPKGYRVRYENVGIHAGETDRCYNGGTIINYKIPRTGETTDWLLWLGGGMTLLTVITGLLLRKKSRSKENK